MKKKDDAMLKQKSICIKHDTLVNSGAPLDFEDIKIKLRQVNKLSPNDEILHLLSKSSEDSKNE